MSTYSIEDIRTSTDRHKLYIILCDPDQLSKSIESVQSQSISVVNIGKELASYIDSLEDYAYLNIDAYDFIVKLMNQQKTKIDGSGNDIVAIYNLGILLEPDIELKAVQLLKDFSKSTCLIIIWENEIEMPNKLFWTSQTNTYYFDFTDTYLKKLQHAV
jgi:hypothetical protein